MENHNVGAAINIRQVLVLQLVLMLAVGGTVRAQGTQTFESQAFASGNWSLQGAYSSPVAGATGSFEARNGDGNPGDYARIVVQMPPNPGCPIGAYAVALNSDAIYDPAVSGPIQSIDYSWDMRISPDEPEFTVGSLALIQNGFLYAAFDARLNTGAPPSPWQNYVINGLTEADFGSYGGWNQAGQPASPDFSESGAPITFGHVVGTSRGFGSFDALCANPPPAGSDLDNWNVVVTSSPLNAPGVFAFETDTYTVDESAGSLAVTVLRNGGSTGAVSVDYDTTDGTALAPGDYTAATGTLDFADGITQQTITIGIVDDDVIEPDETFQLTLSNATGGATVGSPDVTTLTVPANDVPIADLAMSASGTVRLEDDGAGSQDVFIDYVLTVSNVGGDGASGTEVALGFDASQLTWVSDDAAGLFDTISNVWMVGDLGAGAAATLQITFEAIPDASVTLTATASSQTQEPDPDLNSNVTSVQLNTGLQIDVEILGPEGRIILLETPRAQNTITISNTGAVTVANLDVRVEIGRQLAYWESGDPPADFDTPSSCSFSGSIEMPAWNCTVDTLEPGGAVDLFFETAAVDPEDAQFLDAQGLTKATVFLGGTNLAEAELEFTIANSLNSGGGGSGWCFVATAAYGSSWAPNVMVLREFRDDWLLTNAPGRWFVATYYSLSPPIADWIREREWARAATRWALTPLVTAIRYPAGAALFVLLSAVALIGRRRRRRPSAGAARPACHFFTNPSVHLVQGEKQ